MAITLLDEVGKLSKRAITFLTNELTWVLYLDKKLRLAQSSFCGFTRFLRIFLQFCRAPIYNRKIFERLGRDPRPARYHQVSNPNFGKSSECLSYTYIYLARVASAMITVADF